MAAIKIGGTDYVLPRLTLWYLGKTAPFNAALQSADGDMEVIADATSGLLSAWLIDEYPDLTPEKIARAMGFDELGQAHLSIQAAQKESGLPVGELPEGAARQTTRPSKSK